MDPWGEPAPSQNVWAAPPANYGRSRDRPCGPARGGADPRRRLRGPASASAGKPSRQGRSKPRRNTRIAQRFDLRADRPAMSPTHTQGQQALPLLRQPGFSKGWTGACPVGGCQQRRSRPLSLTSCAACCGRRRSSSPRGAPPGRRSTACPRGGPRGAGAARSAVGRALPGRAGADLQLLVERVDVGTTGRDRLRTEGLAHMVSDLAGSPGAAGSGMSDPTVSPTM